MSTDSLFDLTPPEKLQLVEDLWDDLSATPSDVPVHDWQKEELERRKENLLSKPSSGVSWQDVKSRIRAMGIGVKAVVTTRLVRIATYFDAHQFT